MRSVLSGKTMRWARLLLFVAEDEQRAVSAMIDTCRLIHVSLLDCLFCFVCIAFGVVDTYGMVQYVRTPFRHFARHATAKNGGHATVLVGRPS